MKWHSRLQTYILKYFTLWHFIPKDMKSRFRFIWQVFWDLREDIWSLVTGSCTAAYVQYERSWQSRLVLKWQAFYWLFWQSLVSSSIKRSTSGQAWIISWVSVLYAICKSRFWCADCREWLSALRQSTARTSIRICAKKNPTHASIDLFSETMQKNSCTLCVHAYSLIPAPSVTRWGKHGCNKKCCICTHLAHSLPLQFEGVSGLLISTVRALYEKVTNGFPQ